MVVKNLILVSDRMVGIDSNSHSEQVGTTPEFCEMAWMLLDRHTLEPVQNRHVFIKPRSANLMELVKRSESDPSEDLSPSMSLQEALDQFETEVYQVFPDLEETCLVTAGTNPFKVKLFMEKIEHGLRSPSFFSTCKYFDVHQEGPYHLEPQSQPTPAQASALSAKTKRIISEVVEEDISAMERCRKILDYLTLIVNETSFPNALFDTIKDRTVSYDIFSQHESRNILFNGLPSPVRYADIDEILQLSELKLDQVMIPKLQTDSMFPGILLVTMKSHSEALKALNLHGSKFENFKIEVSSSSGDFIDSSLRILEPHRSASPHDRSRSRSPAYRSGPSRQRTLRGDWICQNTRCRTHNFSFRTTCLGCHEPKPDNAEEVPAVVTRGVGTNSSSHQNIRAGDWFCPNRSCNFQNFANRTSCLKCAEPARSRNESSHHSSYRNDGESKMNYRTNQPIKPGDWICGGCKAHNFAHRDRCFQCGSGVPFSSSNSSSTNNNNNNNNNNSYNRRSNYPDMYPSMNSNRDYNNRGDYNNRSDYNNRGGYNHYNGHNNRPYRGYDSYHPPPERRDNYQPRRPSNYDRYDNQYNDRNNSYSDRPSNYNNRGPTYNNRGNNYDRDSRDSFSHKVMAGDWICRDDSCRYHNFARRTTCLKCGRLNR